MKKNLLTIFGILLSSLLWGQGAYINYKAAVSDDAGAVLVNHDMTVKFTVYDDNPSAGGIEIFQETHSTTTDPNGLIVLKIGAQNSSSWYSLDWTVNQHYLKTEFDIGAGLVDMGTQSFNVVPYALFAKNADKAAVAESVDFSDITNVPSDIADGDDDTQLTETQVISYVAGNGYLTTEIDGDNSNELQTLSVSGNQLTISDGNTVTLPTGSGGDQWGSQVVETDASLSGDGTTGNPLTVNGSGDSDFYEVGTTNPAYDINDDIFHMGKMAIGKNSFDSGSTNKNAKVEISNDGLHPTFTLRLDKSTTANSAQGCLLMNSEYTGSFSFRGINNSITGATSGKITGILNYNSTSGNGKHFGVFNQFASNGGHGDRTGVQNEIYTDGNGTHIGVDNLLNGSGVGPHIGVWSRLDGVGTGNHYGTYNEMIGSGSNDKIGVKNYITNTGDGDHLGVGNSFSGEGNGNHTGVLNSIISTGTGEHIGIKSGLSGVGAGEQYGIVNEISNTGDAKHVAINSRLSGHGNGKHYGVYSWLEGTGAGEQVGATNIISNSGGGTHYGIKNFLQGNGGGQKYGVRTQMSGSGSGMNCGTLNELKGSGKGGQIGTDNIIDNSSISTTLLHIGTRNILTSYSDNVHYGVYNDLETSGSGAKYGNYNSLQGTGIGKQYGSYNFVYKGTNGPGNIYGSYNKTGGSGLAQEYGVYNELLGTSSSAQYGVYNELASAVSGTQYGVYSELSGSGGGTKYGVAASIDPSAGGIHYAIYGDATKSGSFAGYFVGDTRVNGGNLAIYKNSNGSVGHLELGEDQAGDGSRIMFTNLLETDNMWTVFGRADDTDGDSYFNIHHSSAGNIMIVRGNGKVGIRRTPVTNTLEVNGIASKSSAGSWVANSDRRLKKNINTINQQEALAKVLSLRGVTYEWNDNKTGNTRPSGQQYGFIAQELKEVFPNKVSKDNLGYYQTAYGDYDPLFVQAFKELSDQTNELKKLVEQQQALIMKLSEKLDKLENK